MATGLGDKGKAVKLAQMSLQALKFTKKPAVFI